MGGNKEYDPYVAIHASFSPYRVKMIDRLVRVRDIDTVALNNDCGDGENLYMSNKIGVYSCQKSLEIELHDYDRMKGDDSIHFKLFTHTRYSGVESIDKSESKYVERQIADGFVQLSLLNLFGFYRDNYEKTGKTTFTLTDVFEDQKVIDEKSRDLLNTLGARKPSDKMIEEMMAKAKPLCRRASVTFRITMHNFNKPLFMQSIFSVPDLTTKHYNSMLPLNKKKRNDGLTAPYSVPSHTQKCKRYDSMLFNSEKTWERWIHTMNDCLGEYCAHFIGDDDNTDAPVPSLYKPSESAVSNLQLPQYLSEYGKMPVYAYWNNHDPYYREYASEEARLEDLLLYGFDARTEACFLMMLNSALRRFGLTPETLIKEIELHFSPKNKSTLPSPNFLRVEQAIAHVGTFAANMADYTADFRFVIETMANIGHALKHKGDIGEIRCCAQCGKEVKVKVLSLDSWDNNILNNTSKCDDCEGQDNTATSVLRSFAIGRVDLGFNWQSEALQAVKKFLDHSVIYDVGALVTSAFVDMNNKKIETKQEELPFIGDALDKNAQNDGHCFGLLQSLTRCITMLEAGNIPKDVIEKVRRANTIGAGAAQATFEKRDSMRTILVLEPTGSIEARLLSLEESYGSGVCDDPQNRLFEKSKAMFFFMKHLRILLKEFEKDIKEDDPENNSIVELFVGEGLPHYVNSQPQNRRVSSFYNSVVHGSSVDLMRFDHTLSQFAFCTDNKYGVRIGTLIRNAPGSKLSLIAPYVKSREKFITDVLPMVESIQNQMAIAKFGRYSEEECRDEIYSLFIPADEMSASIDFRHALPSTKEREAKQLKFERLLREVDSLDSDKTVIRLYSRVWKLNQKNEKTQRLNQFIKALPGLIDYAYYIERHIPVCDPIVEILCIVSVKECLALPVDAK